MDAKPQRIRVRGDENAHIHINQRNKSTLASSVLPQNQVPKINITKRAAFGDVSNTTTFIRGRRDDPAAAKGMSKYFEKPLATDLEDKPATLSQPVLRPMTALSSKVVSNRVTDSEASDLIGKSKKSHDKRDNIVYRDHSQPLPETRAPESKETIREPTCGKSETSAYPPKSLPQKVPTKETQAAKDGLKDHDADTHQHSAPKSDVAEEKREDFKGYENDHESNSEDIAHLRNVTAPETLARPHNHPSHSQTNASTEPEECWDEDDDENEEDEAYATIHSYRSRGDNTTCGATAVILPKYDSQTRRELALAKRIVESTRTAEDIEDEYWDTSMVAEYNDEIFEYIKRLEMKMLPNAHYMDNQAEIQWSMRSVLMDWLVQVHSRFGLLPETLFLCVNCIDRFLSCKIVSLGKLQLVGATAILIASKYEEINCPSVQEIVYMVDGGYTVDEILKAERFMLTLLQFELGWPGPMSFLRRVSKADEYDHETRTMAKYFLEITIMDERFVSTPPSFVAAGAHCLARLFLGKGSWTPAHVHYSGYTYSQLYPLMSLIFECCGNPRKHHATIYEKYADSRFQTVSVAVEREIMGGYHIPAPHELAVLERSERLEASYWVRM